MMYCIVHSHFQLLLTKILSLFSSVFICRNRHAICLTAKLFSYYPKRMPSYLFWFSSLFNKYNFTTTCFLIILSFFHLV